VHSVGQRPNLRHLRQRLRGTEGLVKTVGFKKTTECASWRTSTNASREWVPYWGCISAETTGSTRCVLILCLECFQCYVIIDCCLPLKSCTFQPMVALINHLLTYLLTYNRLVFKERRERAGMW